MKIQKINDVGRGKVFSLRGVGFVLSGVFVSVQGAGSWGSGNRGGIPREETRKRTKITYNEHV